MKKVYLSILIIFLISLSSVVYSGEKEELQLRQQLLQERAGRLQAEFIITNREMKDVDVRLKEIAEQEKKPVIPEKPKVDKK